EGGIRCFRVTAVQTCALPILRNVPLKVALERTLKGSQLHFHIQENTVFIKPIPNRQMAATNTVRSTAAQQPLRGKVTDEQGDPVAGVSVRAKGTSSGTSTDSQGNYVLDVPAGVDILEFTMVGYDAQE